MSTKTTVRERPILFSGPMVRAILEGRKTQTRRLFNGRAKWHFIESHGDLSICPYGHPGDRLWVREAHHVLRAGNVDGSGREIVYRADDPDFPYGWTPSIHMPRWASRIDLEVTGVRAERLQEISDEDARAEGIVNKHGGWNASETVYGVNYTGPFSHLWESINGPGSWDANPWVWVIEFQPITGTRSPALEVGA